MIGKLKANISILARGLRNGEEVLFRVPVGAILEIVRVETIFHEEYNYEEKSYICEITLDGIKYTNIKIPMAFVGDDSFYTFISANQAGGRRKRTRRHRRKSTYRRRR